MDRQKIDFRRTCGRHNDVLCLFSIIELEPYRVSANAIFFRTPHNLDKLVEVCLDAPMIVWADTASGKRIEGVTENEKIFSNRTRFPDVYAWALWYAIYENDPFTSISSPYWTLNLMEKDNALFVADS